MSIPDGISISALRKRFDNGLVLTIALSTVLLLVFYGKLFRDPAHTYFGATDDGLQVYYQTLYHTKYDSAYWHQQSMNYPYGESIFFTSAMPMVNNAVKLFGPSAATTGVALLNLLMLLSIAAGAIFLYLIFRHLRLPWLYGSISAVAIAFFSPQIIRMTGHYSLSWVFLIPAMIFFLMRFYERPTWKLSCAIGLLSLLAATTHLYFFVFFAGLSVMYWLALLITRDRNITAAFALRHFCLQVILPFALVQLLVWLSSDVTDRTTFPKGYLNYRSNMAGIFFPFGQFYQPLFDKIADAEKVESEGMAYVGFAAIIATVVIVLSQLFTLVRGRFRQFFAVTDNMALNIFFWTSLVMLYVSFGHPFLGGREEWLTYLGPLRQFRAIGRFTWVFFYVINIVAVYQLYRLTTKRKTLNYVTMILIAVFLWTDMLSRTIRTSPSDLLNNHIAELEDERNEVPANSWLQEFDAGRYQAILPLPYYHVGSENLLRLTSDREIVRQSYIVSLKTGLPLMAVSSSRTSLSQTCKLISLVMDPSAPLIVLEEMPDQRPLLVIVREATLNANERRLLSLATPVAASQEYKVYSLELSAIAAMIAQQYSLVKAQMDAATYICGNGSFFSTDSLCSPVYFSFDEMNGAPFAGKGSMSRNFREKQIIYEGDLNGAAGEYKITFWMSKITRDVFPRNVIYVVMNDSTGKSPPMTQITDASVSTCMITGDWGLQEVTVKIPFDNAHLVISMWNDDLRPDDSNEVDELLIIPAGTHVYRAEGDTIYCDNRRYTPPK